MNAIKGFTFLRLIFTNAIYDVRRKAQAPEIRVSQIYSFREIIRSGNKSFVLALADAYGHRFSNRKKNPSTPYWAIVEFRNGKTSRDVYDEFFYRDCNTSR